MASDLWDWSLETYKIEGLEPRLLALQDDFDLNVNLILWCVWSATRQIPLPSLTIRKAYDVSRKWTADIVGPVRGARRAAKKPPRQAPEDAAAALYDQLKAVELAGEKIEQTMLSALAADLPLEAGGDPAAIARRNLADYASLAGAVQQPGFSTSLLLDVIECIFSQGQDAE